MPDKKKILFVVEAMGGGLFTYIVDLANELVDEYDMYIAYGLRSQTPEDYRKYFDDRIHLIEVNNFGRSINIVKDVKAFLEIQKIAEEINPDVIHLHSSKAGALGRWAFNGRKTSLFYTPHGYSFLMKNHNVVKRLIYRIEEAVKATLALGLADGAPLSDGKNMAEEAVRPDERNAGELLSLRGSFNQADMTAILPWQENLYGQIVAEAILENVENGVPAEKVAKSCPEIDCHAVEYLLRRAKKQDIGRLEEFSRRIRIYSCLWKITGKNKYSDMCFDTICDATVAAAMESVQPGKYHLERDVTVSLPLRVNWGGGWSDTPPYCMENGGTVLNAAVSIRGKLPVKVTVKRMDKPVIALASTDIGSYKEFGDLAQLQDCRDPSDPFALHKAALIACGVIPAGRMTAAKGTANAKGAVEVSSVANLCGRLGGGMYMNTRVIDIPKGSGLGTSSILAGACVKAMLRAMGQEPTDEEVFERVLCMEQLMSTGGGWQDQVGGIVPGIKLITTRPGLSQKIICTPLAISEETMAELNDRFALIYTGQRRLARNLLRDVVGKYICNDETSIRAHGAIRRLAVLMRSELERGNVNGFASLLTEHWTESRHIDMDSTNACIDQIFAVIDDLIDGRMICGAGGGGFLQVVLKKGVTRDDLRERLHEVFRDSGVDVWECAFV